MSDPQSFPMTVQGHATLRDELHHLKRVERLQISAEIEVARAHGDLRENAEYHAAKERQGMVEARIRELETKLALAEVIDPSKFTGHRVLFGAHVTILDLETEDEVTYQIVGDDEADLDNGTISCFSPIARALIGREEGDECTIKAPRGDRKVEIVEVVFK